MNDLCLVFPDAESALATLIACGLLPDDTTELRAGEYPPHMSVIGHISRDTGEIDAGGEPIIETLPGWHVNALCDEIPDALVPHIVTPTKRFRVWA